MSPKTLAESLLNFIRTMTIGGLVVILPVGLLLFIFKFVAGLLMELIRPITNLVIGELGVASVLANGIVLVTFVALCFVTGLFVTTSLGRWLQGVIDRKILKHAPGYKMIKELVGQLLGAQKPVFSAVALVSPFDSGTQMLGLITDEGADGSCTVYVPFGLNPTSGGHIFHVQEDQVVRLSGIGADEALRTSLSCGAGSRELFAPAKGHSHV